MTRNKNLKKDQKVKLTIDDPTPDTQSIHIGNPNTIKLLSKGTHVKIDDGRIELVVDSVESEKVAYGIIIKEGIVRPGKGFNLYPHPFVQNKLSKDIKFRDDNIIEVLTLKNAEELHTTLHDTLWRVAITRHYTV